MTTDLVDPVAHTPRSWTTARGDGPVVLVPTMGALHDGHVQLLKHGRPLGETLVASIFVNPTQFAPGEDFEEYPRTFDADLERCAEAGVDVVFAPTVDTMYPTGLDATVMVDPGPLGSVLEGAIRPTHFRGVLTVVAKLFGLVRPDVGRVRREGLPAARAHPPDGAGTRPRRRRAGLPHGA